MAKTEKLDPSDRSARRDFQQKLGRYLKDRRLDKDVSQGDIAKLAGFKNPQFISNIERGLCAVPAYVLKIMVKEYSIPQTEFLEYVSDLKMNYYRKLLFEKSPRRKRA